jgi:hypothetical protein
MKDFMRDNLMIVVSVALPLVVVVLFALATLVPNWLVEPPQYNFLMAADGPGYGGELPVRLEFVVTDGALALRAFKLPEGARAYAPRLFEFEAGAQTVREIEVHLPEDLAALGDGAPIALPVLAGRRVDRGLEAPDGYVFERRETGGGGLFTGLFGASRGRYAARLRKDGAVVRIHAPIEGPGYDYNLRFLGWVAE